MENSSQLPIHVFSSKYSCLTYRASAMFMKLINEVLHEHLYKHILVYLDDILIYTETKDEHIKVVGTVLEKL